MKKGFTILELLIVLSLMGLLCGIVLASLDKAREMGMESTIQSQLATLKAQGERYYSKYNKYGGTSLLGTYGLCNDSLSSLGFGLASESNGLLREIANSLDISNDKIERGNETEGKWNYITCHSTTNQNTDSWAVEVPMPESKDGAPVMYCVDSTGITIKQYINLGTYDYFCSGSL